MSSGEQEFQRGCLGCSFWLGTLLVIGIVWRAPKQYLWEAIALTVVSTVLIMIAAASMNDWALALGVFALLFMVVIGRYVVTGNQRYLNETFQPKGKKTAQTTATPEATLPPGTQATAVPAVALEPSPSAVPPTPTPTLTPTLTPVPTLTPAPAAAAALPLALQTAPPTSLFAPLLAVMAQSNQAKVLPGPKWVNDALGRLHKWGLGKIALNRDDARPETQAVKNWRLVLGIILALQFLFAMYYSERVGTGDSVWYTTMLIALVLFSKLGEWVYDVFRWLFDLGIAGKVLSVILAVPFGMVGIFNIGVYFIGAYYYNDVRFLGLCVLPCAIGALPLIYYRWKKIQGLLKRQ